MANKTPLMILNEKLVQKGVAPEYQLIEDGTGTKEPVFTYLITAQGIKAIGTARTKIGAKQNAAKNYLERMNALNEPHSSNDDYIDVDDHEQTPASWTNYVGLLKDLCVNYNMPAPEFELLSDIGPPHLKTFTMMCKVDNIKRSAAAKTKKLAKQLCAQKVYEVISESSPNIAAQDIVTSDFFEKAKKIANDNLPLAHRAYTLNKMRMFSEYALCVQELDSYVVDGINQLCDLTALPIDDAAPMFNRVEHLLDLMNYSHTIVPVENGVFIRIHMDPQFAFYGSNENGDVLQEASEEILTFFKIMSSTKPLQVKNGQLMVRTDMGRPIPRTREKKYFKFRNI